MDHEGRIVDRFQLLVATPLRFLNAKLIAETKVDRLLFRSVRPRSTSTSTITRMCQRGVSFDLNFREKLWNVWGGADRALPVLRRIVQNVDVPVGSEEDLVKRLAVNGPAEAAKQYPQIKIVATGLRELYSGNRHSWSATAWIDGKTYAASTCELEIYDRVGGGDGFVSGLFMGC